jgi:glycine cleavage system H protein
MQPQKLKFTKDHEWVGIENGLAVIGISDYAQKALGDITYIELPKLGRQVRQHEELAVVESVKAASDVFAPVSGKVAAVNVQLNATPELINQDPYGTGWICRLDAISPAEFDALMNFDQYRTFAAEP